MEKVGSGQTKRIQNQARKAAKKADARPKVVLKGHGGGGEGQVVLIDRMSRMQKAFAGVGIVTVAALAASGVAFLAPRAKGSEPANKLAAPYCGIAPGAAGALSEDACKVELVSPLRLAAKDPNNTTGIPGVVKCTLEARPELNEQDKDKLQVGKGIGLVVDVKCVETDKYGLTSLSEETISETAGLNPGEITTEGLFSRFTELAGLGGATATEATQLCVAEVNSWLQAVRAEPEKFENPDFPAAMLRDEDPNDGILPIVIHRTEYVPFTAQAAPDPNVFRREIIFADDNSALLCPEPQS